MQSMIIHLGQTLLLASVRPTRTLRPGNRLVLLAQNAAFLFGLAPGGVYQTTSIAGDAVGSYPTFSPLPCARQGGLFSVALSLGFPPPGVTRHRISMEPGLSSP